VNADPATPHAVAFGLALGEVERMAERAEQFGQSHILNGGRKFAGALNHRLTQAPRHLTGGVPVGEFCAEPTITPA
jgi:hypothetical protein